jgi:CheY-like chemotaxis protein
VARPEEEITNCGPLLPSDPEVDSPQPQGRDWPVLGFRARRRVLIVDDNRDSAESLAQFLSLRNQDVRTAYDGLAALSAATEYQPQVFILDIGLPGLDGFALARVLKSQPSFSGALFVALTGYGAAEHRRECYLAGFYAHLVKPVDPVALMSIMEGTNNGA